VSALAVLMIAGAAGLLVAAVPLRIAALVGAVASLALAAAGFLAVFDQQLVWQPFHWFGLGRGGVHIDQLAGLFLIVAGVVSAPLFVAASTHGPRCARVLRPLLVLCVVGVIVVLVGWLISTRGRLTRQLLQPFSAKGSVILSHRLLLSCRGRLRTVLSRATSGPLVRLGDRGGLLCVGVGDRVVREDVRRKREALARPAPSHASGGRLAETR